MSIRVQRPDTDRLTLSSGDWLLVKRYLNAGEMNEVARAVLTPTAVGATAAPMTIDPVTGPIAWVMAYLLDWSFQHADGSALAIAGQPPAVVRAALQTITFDTYTEVVQAVSAHHNAIAARLAEEKKTRSIPIDSPSTLTSVGP
jgi:hypothetical protein